MWRRAGIALAVLGLLAFSACSSSPARSVAPPFELTDQSGQPWRTEDARGRVTLLTFLYTYCPVACPLTIGKMQAAIESLPEAERQEIAVAIVTVDPERDTPERLREVTSYLPGNWLYLTGTPGQLKTTWDNYGIQVQKGEEISPAHAGHPASYEVTHTLEVIVVDREGRMAARLWGDAWQVPELAQKLDLTLQGRALKGAANPTRAALRFLQLCGPFYFAGTFGAVAHGLFLLTIPVGLFAVYRVIAR